jgi:SAM-dependent methyltransferase
MGISRTLHPRLRRLLLRFIDVASRPLRVDTASDSFHLNFRYFLDQVKTSGEYNVLELGARKSTIREHFDGCSRYVGVDIHPGPGVDVAGDIHELSSALSPLNMSFDAVVTISTFEHLVMPWKAVLEINKVMKPGGLLFIATHPTWPPHELPWDFWRFADGAFHGLLNRATGFEILRCDSGLPCTILPLGTEKSTVGILGQPASMGISVVARKNTDARPDLQWNVATDEILTTAYPLR